MMEPASIVHHLPSGDEEHALWLDADGQLHCHPEEEMGGTDRRLFVGEVLRAMFDGWIRHRSNGSVAIQVLVPEEDLIHYTGPTDLTVEEYEIEATTLTVELTVHRARRKS